MKHNFAKCINTCNFYISFSRRHDRQTYGQTHRRGGIASVTATPNGNGIIQSYGTTKNSSFILWCRWRLCLIAIWKDHMEQLRIWWRGGGGCSEAMASGTYKLHSIFKGVSGFFFGFFGKARVMIMYHHTIEHDLIFCCFMVRFFFGAASTLKPTNAANACNMMPGSSVNLVRFKCCCLH